MPEGNELLRFAAAKKHWGWKDTPPFRVEPPIDDARQLARLFTGRQAELSRVILPLYNGRNILGARDAGRWQECLHLAGFA
jgi:hypothetical protein